MNRIVYASVFLLVLVLPGADLLAQPADSVSIQVEPIRNGVYMLGGRGGNIGLVVGADRVLMIDTQFAPLSERILEAVASVTDQPVRYVLNTHWHADHTDGNANMAAAGALIFAHDNVLARLSSEQNSLFFERTTPPAPLAARPVLTFNERLELQLGGVSARMFHVPAAHTDGDVVVHLPEANVIHTGDIVFYGLYPFIDVDSGGNLPGVIAAVAQIAELADESTVIIPGHGPLINREQLLAYGRMLSTVHDRLRAAIDAGQSLEQIQAAGITAEFDAEWGGGFIPPERWVALLYRSLTEG